MPNDFFGLSETEREADRVSVADVVYHEEGPLMDLIIRERESERKQTAASTVNTFLS